VRETCDLRVLCLDHLHLSDVEKGLVSTQAEPETLASPQQNTEPNTGKICYKRRLKHSLDHFTSLDDKKAKPSDDYGDIVYAKYCGDTALVWKHYMTRAEHDDRELAQVLNGDLESLLLFVSAAIFRCSGIAT
jgi:hypothetical protein